MKPLYESFNDDIELYKKESTHTPPHLHSFLEITYVLSGTLELGVGQELYHMDTGDLALIFPGQIHHSQVFDKNKGKSTYFIASPSYVEYYRNTLIKYEPVNPVIKAQDLHPDVKYALEGIYKEMREDPTKYNTEKSLQTENDLQAEAEYNERKKIIYQSFFNLILTRLLPLCQLVERTEKEDMDLIYRTVAYIAEHFTQNISLTSMAKDLYVSPFALSRIFSGVFHSNFNRYLNETRLEYALSLLRYTDQSITEIYENAGFESQRTFNRVFNEKLHMSPRKYRKSVKKETPDNDFVKDDDNFYVHKS